MHKKLMLGLCSFLVSICLVTQVKAQGDTVNDADDNNNVTTTATDANDGFDWGWLGLIGLLGLAGARGKNRGGQQ